MPNKIKSGPKRGQRAKTNKKNTGKKKAKKMKGGY